MGLEPVSEPDHEHDGEDGECEGLAEAQAPRVALAGQKLLEEQQASKKKKIKVSKKERLEYATIEAEVEELEMAAVKAQAALDEANSGASRLSQKAVLALAGESSAARRAADRKMERYMELDELITMADG